MKRMLRLVGVICTILCMMIIAPNLQVKAANGVEQKLNQLVSMYPNGSYFSANGGACGHTAYDVCNNCKLSSILSARHPGMVGKVSSQVWTCCAFARFNFYYMFGIDTYDFRDCTQVSLNNAKVGDFVKFNMGTYNHYGIFLYARDGKVFIYDANGTGSTNRVAYGNGITTSKINAIYRANNYDAVNGSDDTEKPVISNVQITDVNKDGYTVTCTVTDNVGIDRVEFPTWNAGQSGGGKDATWLRGTINGNTASVRVNVRDWNNYEGDYHSDIYAYDTSGNFKTEEVRYIYIDRTAPQIKNVRVEQIDSTGYTVVCEVTDDRGINRVQFPTWTERDDLIPDWDVNSKASGVRDGDIFRYRVNDSDHYYRRDSYYHTHIYAYDNYGNQGFCGVEDFIFKNQYEAKESIEYNGHKYSLYEDILDWEQAEQKSRALGGHLATITSEGEERAIESLLKGNTKRVGYFLGGTDKGSKGNFRWITGEKFVYSKWADGEPNNSNGNEDYIEICRDLKSWNDVNLNDNGNLGRGFILETDIAYNVASIKLSNSNINLSKKGEQQTIKASISPANATNKTLTWKSSNPTVATVDQNGKVTAVSNGTTNITVTTQDGNKTATCKVTVNIPKPVEPTKPVTPDKPSVSATSVKLNKPSLTLYKGKTYTLKATVKPKTYNSGIKWSSSANKYATVSSKGKITAKKSGRTVITAQTKNGKKATCIIKVKERKATKVKLSRKSLTLKVGRKYALKATVYPKNTTDTKKWTINKKGIVKVSSKGVVTGLKKGKCRITLKTSSGKSAYCNVKVE